MVDPPTTHTVQDTVITIDFNHPYPSPTVAKVCCSCVTLLSIIICADSCLTHTHTHTHILPHGFHAHAQWFNITVATDHELLSCTFGALSHNPLTDFNFCDDLGCGKPLQAWSCTTLVACVSPSCHTTLGDQRWSQPELDTLFAEDQWRRTTMPTTTASVLP